MAFDHQLPEDPLFTIAHTIGQCPYFKVGEVKLIIGTISKLVYTKLIGGTCLAFEQVALLCMRLDDNHYTCVHPGWIHNCNDCHLACKGILQRYHHSPIRLEHIGEGARYPIAKEVLTSTTHPISEEMFRLMISGTNDLVDISDRYDLLEL